MVGHLHKLNPGETSLEWGIWTKGSIPYLRVEIVTGEHASLFTGFQKNQP